jgi:hypothetical protein
LDSSSAEGRQPPPTADFVVVLVDFVVAEMAAVVDRRNVAASVEEVAGLVAAAAFDLAESVYS